MLDDATRRAALVLEVRARYLLGGGVYHRHEVQALLSTIAAVEAERDGWQRLAQQDRQLTEILESMGRE